MPLRRPLTRRAARCAARPPARRAATSGKGPVLVAIDVGGTTTAAGAVTTAGQVLFEEHVPTHRAGRGTALELIESLVAGVRAAVERRGLRVGGIGVGVPGIVDAARGRVGDEIPHVPELARFPLRARLRERFGLPVVIDNDVNALALGEWMFGAGRGARSLVVLAPGTGFGTGVVLDGRIVRGAGGFAGEFGHVSVKFDGPPCWCGGRGCVARYASGRGIAEAARARVAGHPASPLLAAAGGDPGMIHASMVFEAAASGEPAATAVIREACHALGALIGVVVNGLNPEVVVITGGVTTSYAPLEREVLAAAAEYAFARALGTTRIAFVPGDKGVTVRGPAALVLYEQALHRAR